jgi:signal transduction histidine kinase
MPDAREQPGAEGPVDREGGEYLPRSRVERVISVGRLVVVVCYLLAFRLDPSGFGDRASIVTAVLGGYLVFLIAVVVHVWTGHAPAPRWRVAGQVFDGVLGLVLLSLTGGTSGPFFSYLSFSVLFATLRWQWRGALGVGVPLTLGFVALGIAQAIGAAPQFEANTFIVHTTYLAALTGLLCYFGAHERKVGRNILRVAAWNPPSGVDVPHVEHIVQTAAAVLGAPRAVLAWAERGDSALRVAFWTGEDVIGWDDDAWRVEDLVAAELAHVDFLSHDVGTSAATITVLANGRLERGLDARAIPVELQERFAMRSVIAVRLHGERLRGRFFLLDMPDMTSDDLVTAGLLARQIQCRLEDRLTARQFAAAAAAEERVQLARDVHDGALQSLAGIRLQLEAVRRLVKARPEEAERVLLEVQDVVGAEQLGLRRVVTRLQRVGLDADPEVESDLADRITVLVLRIERQWNVRITVLTPIVYDEFDAVLPLGLGDEVCQIVREALINAARHAHARSVTISVGADGEAVQLSIADDGEGFPFTGRYDLARLARFDLGPAVLRERVVALGGALTIESSPQGARLDISIPFTPPPRLSVVVPSIER